MTKGAKGIPFLEMSEWRQRQIVKNEPWGWGFGVIGVTENKFRSTFDFLRECITPGRLLSEMGVCEFGEFAF